MGKISALNLPFKECATLRRFCTAWRTILQEMQGAGWNLHNPLVPVPTLSLPIASSSASPFSCLGRSDQLLQRNTHNVISGKTGSCIFYGYFLTSSSITILWESVDRISESSQRGIFQPFFDKAFGFCSCTVQ